MESASIFSLVIYRASLPGNVKGFCVDFDGGFTVAVNSNLDEDTQAAAFLHECLHIWNRDHDRREPFEAIEESTEQQVKRIAAILKNT